MTELEQSACERALDYAYGELSEAERVSFEAHLAGCARCREELEGIGRVRSVARTALAGPPAPPLSELVRAAAKRRRSRLRTILFHPGFAAAAGVIVIGGALGLAWTQGRLRMPVAMAPVAAPVAAEPAAPIAAAPLGQGRGAVEPLERAAARHAEKPAEAKLKTMAADSVPKAAPALVAPAAAPASGSGLVAKGAARDRRKAVQPQREAKEKKRLESVGGAGASVADEDDRAAAPLASNLVQASRASKAEREAGTEPPAAAPRAALRKVVAEPAAAFDAEGKSAVCPAPPAARDRAADAAARLTYVHCLRDRGQLAAAERALDGLRKDRLLSAATLATEERALTEARAVRAKAGRPAGR